MVYLAATAMVFSQHLPPRPEILDDLPSQQLLWFLASIYLLDPGFLMVYPQQLLWFLASIYLLDRDF